MKLSTDQPKPNDAVEVAAWASRIERLLESQVNLCDQLERIADDQSRIIRAGTGDEVLASLAQRQALIDQASTGHEELRAALRTWATSSRLLPSWRRERLETTLDDVAARLDRIRSRDEADHAALEARRQSILDQMESSRRGRDAVSAYNGGPTGGRMNAGRVEAPFFQDRQG